MQVVQTGDTVKRQEALAREAGFEKAKHHVNAIIDDDFWQVVRHEKLGEGDFEVESSMSFGGSQCDRINALRPPPKPLANPPEPTTNPSDTTPEPMRVDETTEGRRLRKKKKKIPKNLKREANEKEMDGFTKRVLRIPVEKPFDEVYFTHRLWMFFRETKETEEDIRRMFHHVTERMKIRITLKKKSDPGKFAIPCVVKGIEFPHALCDTGASANLVELGNDLGYIAACHCGAEYETEYSESNDTRTVSSIDSNESPMTDERYPTSLDGMQPVVPFTLPDQCYPDFAFQQPNKRGRDDYSIGSHSFNNTSPPSIDRVHPVSVDTHPHPAKRSYASIDTIPGTSIDIKATAFEKEKENIPIPSRFTNTYIRSFALHITSHDTEAEKMNAPTNQSEGTSRRSIQSKNPNSADKRLPSIDTPVSTSIDTHSKPQLSLFTKKTMSMDFGFLTHDEFDIFRDPDGHARAMDGRILKVSREDIADIIQVANGPENLFMQKRNILDNISTVLDEHPGANTTAIGSHQSYRQGCSNIVRHGNTNVARQDTLTIDRQTDEFGYARSIAGELIHVTKDNIRKILERASLYEESHIYLLEHATSFTPTRLAPEIYTKDEINEMVTGIRGAQERLGDELKTLVDDTYQPLDRGYNELFRSMAEMRTEIESMQHSLEKEATTSPSIDANKATSIDVRSQTSQIPAEPESLAEKKDDWEITYINTKIHDVYNPLNNNVDWLSTRIDLLQQDLDTICKKDQQPATSIDICTITSIDSKFADMEDRLQTYEDMHDRFTSPIMRYLDSLSTQMMKVQKDIGKLNDQHDFQEEDNIKALHNYKTMKERLEKRCDDIYFPFDVRLGGLDSQAEWLQKEVKGIQRKLASQHQISASIDRARFKSIDSTAPATIDRHMVASIDTTSTPDDEQLIHNKMESMHEELNELSAYAYDKIGWNKFSIENILERLQDISNAIQKMDGRWTKNDQATRSFIAACLGRARSKSIDSTAPATIDRHMVASIDTKSTSDDEQLIHNKMESMHEELNELSAYAYDKIGWHQFSIETLQERLQNISNAIQKMDERWTRNDEATRNSTKDAKVDQPVNYTHLP
ncbi:hypothetical protein F2Q70_00031414 [Brassica cretica]|uniref:Uncharacterized protein n=1 Tax=Brassica cretica TaxID=69181 RepID=A0A8S9FMQ3_BRACR|nr:hypothetical protein F2Q70_00031414 [Brassica cretica]